MERARPAAAADHRVCTELLGHALSAATRMRGGPALVGAATAAALVARWSEPGGSALLVGEYDGAVVGLAGVTVSPPHTGRRRGAVECCYVDAAARGVGVGTALLDAALRWCSAQGCTDVDAWALPGDRATKQRLEGAGFSARLLTLSRQLG